MPTRRHIIHHPRLGLDSVTAPTEAAAPDRQRRDRPALKRFLQLVGCGQAVSWLVPHRVGELWSWVSGVRVPSLTPSCIAGDLRVWQQPEVFLTGLSESLLRHLCDVDHMESHGVSWRVVLHCAARCPSDWSHPGWPHSRETTSPERALAVRLK
jgi:hypothetical protein